tara:strand:- start:325 stop:543 length:219 start_codon:yes stop_codon:yes gene_type:complete
LCFVWEYAQAAPFKAYNTKHMSKTKYTFKPFDSLEWNNVTEKEAQNALSESSFKDLKTNKLYNTAIGTFKLQ